MRASIVDRLQGKVRALRGIVVVQARASREEVRGRKNVLRRVVWRKDSACRQQDHSPARRCLPGAGNGWGPQGDATDPVRLRRCGASCRIDCHHTSDHRQKTGSRSRNSVAALTVGGDLQQRLGVIWQPLCSGSCAAFGSKPAGVRHRRTIWAAARHKTKIRKADPIATARRTAASHIRCRRSRWNPK